MSRTVFILGAGASARAGVPLMKNFIEAAQNVRRTNRELEEVDREAFDLVLKARAQVQAIHSKAALDLGNIEALFGIFEMASLLGKLGNLSAEEIRRLPDSVIRLITRTIESTLQLTAQGGGDRASVQAAPPYGSFAKLLEEALVVGGVGSVAVLTFNYDLALDHALYRGGVPFTYRLGDEPEPKLDLLKLHGSLNWARCPECSAIVPYDLRDYYNRHEFSFLAHGQRVVLDVSRRLASKTHCNNVCCAQLPVIVPPTWNKGKYHHELVRVWERAARHLSEAENIFVIGYSLPETDEFFRYFYGLGAVGDAVLSRMWVVDPDSRAATAFRGIFGTQALSCFTPLEKTFEHAIPEFRRALGVFSRAASQS